VFQQKKTKQILQGHKKQKGFIGRHKVSETKLLSGPKAFCDKQKGFIGAIGDDLPSLVPIFFSLLIFFGTLSYVFITLNEKNTYLEKYFESISVSKEALGSSFFSGYAEFEERVASINTTENYIVGLIYDPNLLGNEGGGTVDTLDRENFIKSCQIGNNEEYIIPYLNPDPYIGPDVYYTGKGADQDLCDSNVVHFFIPNDVQYLNNPTDVIDAKFIFKNQTPFIYFYPVALSTSEGVITAYLYVLVW